MLKDLYAAVIEKATKDYVDARKKLAKSPIPINELRPNRDEAMKKFNTAKMYSNVTDMRYWNEYLSKIDKYLAYKDEAETLVGFFLGDGFDFYSDELDGEIFLETINKKYNFESL